MRFKSHKRIIYYQIAFYHIFSKLETKTNSIFTMNRLLIFICIFLFFIGCQTRQKQNESNTERETDKTTKPILLSTEEKEAGWQLLFDGETKNGWHIYNNQSEGTAWETRDGVLHLNPREIKVTPVPGAGDLTQAVGGGDLATEEDYDNFHLKLEWKIAIHHNNVG